MFAQKLGFLLVVCMRQFHFDFYCFSNFLDWVFFLNVPNPFLVHSRASSLFEPNFLFSLGAFLFTCGVLTLFFSFFCKFLSVFFRNGFPNSVLVRSRSSVFFSQ